MTREKEREGKTHTAPYHQPAKAMTSTMFQHQEATWKLDKFYVVFIVVTCQGQSSEFSLFFNVCPVWSDMLCTFKLHSAPHPVIFA